MIVGPRWWSHVPLMRPDCQHRLHRITARGWIFHHANHCSCSLGPHLFHSTGCSMHMVMAPLWALSASPRVSFLAFSSNTACFSSFLCCRRSSYLANAARVRIVFLVEFCIILTNCCLLLSSTSPSRCFASWPYRRLSSSSSAFLRSHSFRTRAFSYCNLEIASMTEVWLMSSLEAVSTESWCIYATWCGSGNPILGTFFNVSRANALRTLRSKHKNLSLHDDVFSAVHNFDICMKP